MKYFTRNYLQRADGNDLSYVKIFFFFAILIFFSVGLFAAPLGTNYPSAQGKTPAQARQLVVEAGKKYLGVPYVYAGLSNRGLDCSGFIRVSYNDALGIPFARMPASAAGQHSWAERVSIANAQPGDLLFFRTGTTSAVTHVGLYVGNRQFLHAASAGPRTGIIYSNLDETYYSERFVSAGRAIPAGSSSSSGATRQRTPEPSNDRPKNTEAKKGSSDNLGFFVSAGAAPIWNIINVNGQILRGLSTHVGVGKEFSSRFTLGFELRPGYDFIFDLFRMPITLSLSPGKMFTFFGGPVISFTDTASFEYTNNKGAVSTQEYDCAPTWFGTAGVTFTPFVFNIKSNDIAPYIEASWMRYSRINEPNRNPDLSSWIRVTTGLRWRLHL